MNQSFKNYTKSVQGLKKECAEHGINDEEFKKLYLETLESVNKNEIQKTTRSKLYAKKRKLLLILVLLLVTVCSFKYIYNNILCNLQEFIYPGLRLIRKISIPFISLFPALTELYQEPCLIQNPFYTIVDMDCWPCSTVGNVHKVLDPQPVHQQNTAPFIYQSTQPKLDMNVLRDLYLRNRDTFDKESSKILMNNNFYVSPSQVLVQKTEDKNLYIWKINNINIARILRQIIPRAKVVPKFGQSTERYIIIDSSQTTFKIPDTECNFAFLLSLSGARTVTLSPAEECKHQCKSLKVDLKESDLLWYNWWYWRPVVQQSNDNTTFIAHVGSYC
ncbi:uncharacterized protein LOC106713556 [Papilio machaon]|uniref:uncharacterized protein LOC106713556 n=1 Tax=Papilio machaon TaxID=76193 RepID=UPI001E662BC8|nr:uncharacterized protein LOC106713556 [Papilio machaon]XP_014361867.2 uncharacterized protein LOC106713556 [Papilio machaon]